MYWTTTTEQEGQPQRPSASAPTRRSDQDCCTEVVARLRDLFEPHLHRSDGRGGRAGLKPRRKNVARRAFRCAASSAASIRVPPGGATSHWPKLPTCSPYHSVSIRQFGRVELPITFAESATSIFLIDTFLGVARLPVSAAESARDADASHTLPSQIHSPKGLR